MGYDAGRFIKCKITTPDLIEELLNEEEGATLDFKSEQGGTQAILNWRLSATKTAKNIFKD